MNYVRMFIQFRHKKYLNKKRSATTKTTIIVVFWSQLCDCGEQLHSSLQHAHKYDGTNYLFVAAGTKNWIR